MEHAGSSLLESDQIVDKCGDLSSSSLEPSPKKFKLFTPYDLTPSTPAAPQMNDSCGSRQDTSSAGSSEAASSEFDFDKNHPSSDEFEEDEGEDEEEINIEEVEV